MIHQSDIDCKIIIPARYESSRFEGKPLEQILGVPMIKRVWLQCIKAISKNCGDELDKHNAILEYNNKLVNNSGDKIEKNTRDIKKLLLNF